MFEISSTEWTAILLSLRVAIIATLVATPFGIALAWLLARRNFWGKSVLDALVHLPLVLPPVVTGYLLLLTFGKRGLVGAWLADHLGIVFAFRWTGAALAAAIMGFPLMVRAIRLSIEAIDQRLETAAQTLGGSRPWVFVSITLPLALPGIVTGMALNATINTAGIGFSTSTIIVGHATFCVVTVYNNVIARLRRSSRSIEEASMDLGADTWQTFRYVTFPVIRTALLAGGMLAFALSFDEIIVTQFTAGTQETIPIWILNHLHQPNQRSIVNVVALFLILLSTLPVYLANRLTTDTSSGAAGRL